MNKMRRWMRRPLQYRTYRYPITYVIIFINVLLFLLTSTVPALQLFLGMSPFLVLSGGVWSFVTYMFVHGGISHLFFNMLALFFFGMVVERTWGSNEYILLYSLIGILSGVFSFFVFFMTGLNAPLIGASGAVYGVMLVFACLYPHQRIYVFGIFPVTAKVLMLIFIVIQLFSLFSGRGMMTGISYVTHLAGIVIAWLYLYYRHDINPYHRLTEK